MSRSLRLVEVSQSMIRIVGLSATLPNYRDVATFLGVNHDTGLFHFGPGYRPIPLEQQYIGVMEKNIHKQKADMNAIAYTKVVEALRNDKQAMIFVHSRKVTAKTARALLEMAQVNGDIELFDPDARDHPQCALYKKDLGKSRNGEMSELALRGFGVHHAGMRVPTAAQRAPLRRGLTRVLCCTATLAGVNLPAIHGCHQGDVVSPPTRWLRRSGHARRTADLRARWPPAVRHEWRGHHNHHPGQAAALPSNDGPRLAYRERVHRRHGG